MWGEILTTSEVDYCRSVRDELSSVSWVAPLLARLEHEPWNYQTKPLLFELRVAAELHRAGLTAHYEYPTGIGSSSVDFQFEYKGREWLVEVVSILVSDAVKAASWESGMMFGTDLSSDAVDPRQSPGAELIVAQQKIGEKVWDGETWVKFPAPTSSRYHVILADMRGMAITGGDRGDYAQLAYGPQALSSLDVPIALRFNGELVRGVFEPMNNRLRSAAAIRQRIHFLGFCNDEIYEPGSMQCASSYLPNPHLLGHEETATALQTLALRGRGGRTS